MPLAVENTFQQWFSNTSEYIFRHQVYCTNAIKTVTGVTIVFILHIIKLKQTIKVLSELASQAAIQCEH